MLLALQYLTPDNVCGLITALLLVIFYSIPMETWKRIIPSKALSNEKLHPQQVTISRTSKQGGNVRKVTILSPLPHPPTDTTEVTEESETSEMTTDSIQEVFRSALSTPSPKTRPVKVVGKPSRLANIPESPCPALNSALKLKRKLLRPGACSSRSVSSSASSHGGSSRKPSHRRSTTANSIPKTPRRLPLQRHSSVDHPMSTRKRDSYFLNRLSQEQESSLI